MLRVNLEKSIFVPLILALCVSPNQMRANRN
jgi:hypothetical protein